MLRAADGSSGALLACVTRRSAVNCFLLAADGRLCLQLFFLPWEGSTICGTTDSTSDLTMLPKPTEEEVHFILEESNRCGMCESWTVPSVGAQSRTVLCVCVSLSRVAPPLLPGNWVSYNRFLSRKVSRGDVRAAWSGIRPLVRDNKAGQGTSKVSRKVRSR